MKNLRSKILIVDDEKAIQKFLRLSLKTENHEVISAYSASEGIREITLSHPDLVLLDINLPDTTGWDVLRRISTEQRGRIPVIAVSAGSMSQRRIEELQPDRWLEKPFPMDSLLRMLVELEDESTAAAETGRMAGSEASAREGE